MTIKFVARAGMHQLHELVSGKQIDTPLEALKIIAIVLKQLACQRCVQPPWIYFSYFSFLFSFIFLCRFLFGISIYLGFLIN